MSFSTIYTYDLSLQMSIFVQLCLRCRTYRYIFLLSINKHESLQQISHYVSIIISAHMPYKKLIVWNFFRGCTPQSDTIARSFGVYLSRVRKFACEFCRCMKLRLFEEFLVGCFSLAIFVKPNYSCIACMLIRLKTVSFWLID